MLIYDKEQFNKFINILPDLQNDEVYFISLSARNKYLTDEERKFYGLGRTEMFSRNIIRKKEDFEYVLSKLESTLHYKLTKTKQNIPEKALVVYININPSSMIKAYFNLANEMNKELLDINMAMQHNKQPNYSGIHLLDRKLMNCIQTARSRKIFIDIDFDVEDDIPINGFMMDLRIREIKSHTIKTKSGYHCLIDLASMKDKKFNLNSIVLSYNVLAKQTDGEVIINTNGMIPVPGTLQAGELVRFL
jgi:hypothetical protein